MKTYFRFAAIAVAALTLGVACEELTETPKDDSQNTETPETPQEPEKPAEPEKPVDTYVSIADFNAAAVSEEVTYKVKGEIVSIEEISGSFNNATLTIADESGATLYIYRMKPAGETNIADLGLTLGDILSVEGQRGEYNGKIQMVAGVYISHEDKEAPVVQITDISLADFNALEDSDVSLYRIKGTIIEIGDINEQYQNVNLTIADEAGTEVYIYRMKMADNAEQTLADLALKAGDVLTLVGNKGSYEGDPQMVNGKYESHVVGVPPVEYSIDGKQWCLTLVAMGNIPAVLDLGVFEEGMAVLAVDGSIFGASGMYPYFVGEYKITTTSPTEGVIKIVDPTDPSGAEVVITYKDLAEKSVTASNELPFMLENVTLTLAEEKIEISIPEIPDEPEEPAELSVDGKQWSFVWEAMGLPAIFDFGVSAEGFAVMAIDATAIGMPGLTPYFAGTYTITPADETSGTISMVDPSDPSGSQVVLTYNELTETTVKISNAVPFMLVDCLMTVKSDPDIIPGL